jgi:hypothetical protein
MLYAKDVDGSGQASTVSVGVLVFGTSSSIFFYTVFIFLMNYFEETLL